MPFHEQKVGRRIGQCAGLVHVVPLARGLARQQAARFKFRTIVQGGKDGCQSRSRSRYGPSGGTALCAIVDRVRPCSLASFEPLLDSVPSDAHGRRRPGADLAGLADGQQRPPMGQPGRRHDDVRAGHDLRAQAPTGARRVADVERLEPSLRPVRPSRHPLRAVRPGQQQAGLGGRLE